MLWQKFCEGGKVEDYLEYRKAAVMRVRESEKSGENIGIGYSNQGTEYR